MMFLGQMSCTPEHMGVPSGAQEADLHTSQDLHCASHP